jgi:hypothetical protein
MLLISRSGLVEEDAVEVFHYMRFTYHLFGVQFEVLSVYIIIT